MLGGRPGRRSGTTRGRSSASPERPGGTRVQPGPTPLTTGHACLRKAGSDARRFCRVHAGRLSEGYEAGLELPFPFK